VLSAARFFEAQASGAAQPVLHSKAHHQTGEPITQHLRIDPERVADAVERKRIVAAVRRDPLAGFREGAPFAGAAHPIPTLQYVDCVHQHREHQTLLGTQSVPAHSSEELAGQDNVGKCEWVTMVDLAFRLMRQLVTPFQRDGTGPISNYRREAESPRLAGGETSKLKMLISLTTHCYKSFKKQIKAFYCQDTT
jgi:hypothetical protein